MVDWHTSKNIGAVVLHWQDLDLQEQYARIELNQSIRPLSRLNDCLLILPIFPILKLYLHKESLIQY